MKNYSCDLVRVRVVWQNFTDLSSHASTTLDDRSITPCDVIDDVDMEMRALDWMWGTWLPTSGYVPSDQPCFESWIGEPFAHGIEHFELCVQIPVERP